MELSLILTRCANLAFLEPIVTEVMRLSAGEATVLRLGLFEEVQQVIATIGKQTSGLVIIMSHGLDGCLLVGEHASDEHGRRLPRWMNADEISCLENKRVFCLACQSASLAESAMGAGALAFLGFGDIEHFRRGPSGEKLDEPEFSNGYEKCLAELMICAMQHLIRKDIEFFELLALVKMAIIKQALRFARDSTRPMAKEVAKRFLRIESYCVASGG